MIKSAFQGGLWLSAFSFISQAFSWCATLLVARLLAPGDYGLMAMATMMTGFIQVFYEMGIGAAIVQRERVTQDELSSVFWALVFWGGILSLLCLGLAYPTVALFGEPRLLRITQAASLLLILGPVFVVPSTLLRRQLRFKILGFVQAAAVVVACSSMVVMAYLGAGVWTLILGTIIRSIVSLTLVLLLVGWRPGLHFRYHETLPYLRFGLPVIGGQSLSYVSSQAPVFFGGRTFSASALGQYSLAYTLASIPNDKILSLITNVAYPVMSRLQNDDEQFKRFCLQVSKFVSFVVLPLYLGGFFLADDLIPWLLGAKWQTIVIPFKLLCLTFAVRTVNMPTILTNAAQGRPHWTFWFQAVCAVTMTAGFYFAVRSGAPENLAIPWVALYVPSNVVFSWLTLRKVGIPLGQFLGQLVSPLLATLSMLLMLSAFRYSFVNIFISVPTTGVIYVLLSIGLGAAWYGAYLFLLQRPFLNGLVRLAGPQQQPNG